MTKPVVGPPKYASFSRLEQPEASEAVRRYKLAREATRARLAPSDRAHPLSPAQVRAHIDLTSATERLERFRRAAVKLALERYGPTPGGKPRHVLRDLLQEPERLKEFRECVTFLDHAVLTAARRGVACNARVADRLRTLRAVGDWATLRQARLGLEKGVRRALSAKDLARHARYAALFQEFTDLVASGQHSNWEKIRHALTDRKIIQPMSRVAFLKLRRGLGFPGRLPKP